MNKNDELVTIITCNRNYGKYLSTCINSINNQTYNNLEFIFIDDASNDNSIDVFQSKSYELTKKGIDIQSHLFDNPGGKVRSLNKALEMAKGKYCVTLDSDDILNNNYIEITKKEIEIGRTDDTQLGFVYTNCELIDEQDNFIQYGFSRAFDPVILKSKNYIPDNGLTLMKILKDSLPFDETIKIGSKHHKWKKIVTKGWKGKHLPRALFKYRLHNNNLSGIGNRILHKNKTKIPIDLSDAWYPL